MTDKENTRFVMAVDDDTEWLAFICTVLVEQCPVLCVSEAEVALGMAAAVQPAVIMLDVMMPGGRDGFAIFCELAKNPATTDIPVIMFTQVNEVMDAEFTPELMKDHLGRAPVAFLEKPIAPEELFDAVRSAIG